MRERILQEATRLMAERGYEGTSLAQVADAVGIKKPSVLYHFKTKDDLRKAVLEALLSRWAEVLPRLLMASTKTGLAKFEAVVAELVGFFAEDPDRARLLVRELLDRPDEMQAVLHEHVQPWIAVVAGFIASGQKSGQIREDVDPEAFVTHVVSMALFSLAASTGAGPLVAGEGGPIERTTEELFRMTRTSLFTESYLEHQRAKRKTRRAQGAE